MNTPSLLDATMMNEAEEELRTRLVDVFEQAFEGQQLVDGVKVADIWSFGLAEDGKTFMVMADLEDGHTALISVCPGESITASFVM